MQQADALLGDFEPLGDDFLEVGYALGARDEELDLAARRGVHEDGVVGAVVVGVAAVLLLLDDVVGDARGEAARG